MKSPATELKTAIRRAHSTIARRRFVDLGRAILISDVVLAASEINFVSSLEKGTRPRIRSVSTDITSGPTDTDSVPTDIKSVSTEIKSAPADIESAPIEIKSAPADIESAPIEIKSAPTDVRPAPIEIKSAPTDLRPAPIEIRSAPIETKSATERIETFSVRANLTVPWVRSARSGENFTSPAPMTTSGDVKSPPSEVKRVTNHRRAAQVEKKTATLGVCSTIRFTEFREIKFVAPMDDIELAPPRRSLVASHTK